MEGFKQAFIKWRSGGRFALSITVFCLLWMLWNWLPWLPHIDEAWEFPVLVYILSLEASIGTAVVYGEQLKSDALFRAVLERGQEEQALRVKEILKMLKELEANEHLEG